MCPSLDARTVQVKAVNERLLGTSRGEDLVGAAKRDLFVAGRYPSELEHDVVVRTGTTARLRPIRPDDAQKLVRFHNRLTSDAIYRRYFSLHPELSVEEVRHLTEVDYVDRLALVVEEGGELLAVGRFDRYPLTTKAEVAFIVDDGHQHLGLGHLLLANLADAAWARGITTFTAETLARNHDMLAVFRHSGYPVKTSFADGEATVTFSIEPTQESATLHGEHLAGGV
jgi:GNAT superfamily N-acetyltransferase